jgi:cytochrome o ubiquinol oxidase operon protein cyoD
MDEGTLKSYIAGFVSSIVLTLVAYVAVADPQYLHVGSMAVLTIILALAVLQLVVQMLFFLHVAAQPGRRWKLTIFFATLGLVIIITLGSLWIMNHLNYNMMASPSEMNQYIQDQQGF